MNIKISENGVFSGYASIFGKIDQGGDIVVRGAFENSLRKRGTANIRMLFQHDPKEPVGIWQSIKETDVGLKVVGRLSDDVARGHELISLIRDGGIDGLSIGFRTLRASTKSRAAARRLYEIDLWEISIVTFPMLDVARISAPQLAQNIKQATKLLTSTQ
ncbi:HK97 family phage prohead protease [Maritalea porphyrae]|uniref:HK97 family phage prohead protease n=1 Tax=Maritalea porphyrae TaxID=880732 RepID=UPI0022AF5A28|nr:HK97 family phage prohead protease [Maritalea porphyrae]MCZ4271161.1 HK97 family phage prohead protease [Maritalea porphyrae]